MELTLLPVVVGTARPTLWRLVASHDLASLPWLPSERKARWSQRCCECSWTDKDKVSCGFDLHVIFQSIDDLILGFHVWFDWLCWCNCCITSLICWKALWRRKRCRFESSHCWPKLIHFMPCQWNIICRLTAYLSATSCRRDNIIFFDQFRTLAIMLYCYFMYLTLYSQPFPFAFIMYL